MSVSAGDMHETMDFVRLDLASLLRAERQFSPILERWASDFGLDVYAEPSILFAPGEDLPAEQKEAVPQWLLASA